MNKLLSYLLSELRARSCQDLPRSSPQESPGRFCGLALPAANEIAMLMISLASDQPARRCPLQCRHPILSVPPQTVRMLRV